MTLCIVCLKEYRKSKQGRAARHARKMGEPASWGRGHWPHEVYHTGDDRLCIRHAAKYKSNVKRRYEERSGSLGRLGFDSYRDYLESDLWKSIRAHAFSIFGSECHFCGKMARQIHHADYSIQTMSGETFKHLYPVCPTCHERGEFEASGEKCSPWVATIRMRRLACEEGHTASIRRRERHRERQRKIKFRSPTPIAPADPLANHAWQQERRIPGA